MTSVENVRLTYGNDNCENRAEISSGTGSSMRTRTMFNTQVFYGIGEDRKGRVIIGVELATRALSELSYGEI